MKTKSQIAAEDVASMLRARFPLLWVITREEARVEGHLFEAASSANYVTRFWDIAQGVTNIAGKPEPIGGRGVDEVLATIQARAAAKQGSDRCVWVLRDLPIWLGGGLAGATPLRSLRNLARTLPSVPRDSAQAIVILTPSSEIPPELAGHATVLEWPMPDRPEIKSILEATLDTLTPPKEDTESDEAFETRRKARWEEVAPDGVFDAAVDAAIGLSGEETQACYASSLVKLRKIDPPTIAREKKRVITRERVLEWMDPLPEGLDAVGGLENLKDWMRSHTMAYSQAARDYGLPAPKGILLVGVPGSGKTYFGKGVATEIGGPLLKLDFGALKSKYVGESEQQARRAYRTIEAIGRCAVLVD
jgi:hypothetical protein